VYENSQQSQLILFFIFFSVQRIMNGSNFDDKIPLIKPEFYLEKYVPRTGSTIPLAVLYGLKKSKQ